MRGLSARYLCGASALAMLLPAVAQAQSAPPAPVSPAQTDATARSDDMGGEIIVTARRRDESVQDVPAVINPVTADAVARLNFRSFNEIQTLVPGLSLSNVSNGSGGNAQLRGVNFDINASGTNPTVEFYQNDAPITAGIILQQVYDVGQIEVLRGPQGTLRGRASPSGSITVTTHKPDLNEIGGYLSATGNNIGTVNANGAIGLPIIEGIAAIRFAGVVNQDEANRVRTVNGGIDGRDPYARTTSGRVTLVVTPFDALRLEGSYQRLDRRARIYDQTMSFDQANPSAAASPIEITAKDRETNQESPTRVHQVYDIYNGRAELAVAGQRLVYQFQRYTQKINSVVESDLGNAFPNFDFFQSTNSRPKTRSHELRLQNEQRVFGVFDYVVGLFDNVNNTPTDLTIQTPVFLPAFLGGRLATVVNTPVTRAGRSHEKSAFGNLTAHIGDRIDVSGGLRYIDYRSTGALIVSGTTIPDPEIKAHKVIYTGSAQYRVSRDLMFYASTGSSYRPGINAIGDFSVAQSARERNFLNLGPETSKSYEAGLKSTFLDGRLRANVSGFHQKFDNYPFRSSGNGIYYVNSAATVNNGVVSVTPQVSVFNFVAAVPVTVNGVEGELSYDLSRQVKVGLLGSYALGKIKNGVIPCNDLNGDGVPDTVTAAPTLAQLQGAVGANNVGACNVRQRSSFQPPLSLTLQAEYGRSLTVAMDGYVRGLVSYYGKSQSDPSNTFDDVSAYALVNLYAGIRGPDGAWEVSLFAKNLFDTTKVLSQTTPLNTSFQVLQAPTFRTAAASSFSSSYVGITTNPPREFGLNIRYAFGSR